jgi:hypothetical protein
MQERFGHARAQWGGSALAIHANCSTHVYHPKKCPRASREVPAGVLKADDVAVHDFLQGVSRPPTLRGRAEDEDVAERAGGGNTEAFQEG